MLFNSVDFFIFLFIVCGAYLALRRHLRAQNAMLLVASYVFYAWWDWRFLSLIAASTVVDFWVARRMVASEAALARRRLLTLSCVFNLGLLGVFKYFDFFVASAAPLVESLGFDPGGLYLHVILPVGISFYTFQTMSYTIDVYRGSLEPTDRFFDFALFVSFFPQLVAGPIERASRLLPQVLEPRSVSVEMVRAGLWLIGWGLFKKIFVADSCALIVNEVFGNDSSYGSIAYLAAIYAFAFQIYCDFSGYTDIARGVAKLLGFEIMLNFNLPYLAISPSDFWRRWHISLSTWLRDYLYISMGGNRGGVYRTYQNLMVTMALGGLWHGASWTMIAWGVYHGTILIVERIFSGSVRGREIGAASSSGYWLRVFLMFHVTCVGWLLFRATSLEQVFHMLGSIVTLAGFQPDELGMLAKTGVIIAPLLLVQALQFRSGDLMFVLRRSAFQNWVLLISILALCYLGINLFGIGYAGKNEFIYFQF